MDVCIRVMCVYRTNLCIHDISVENEFVYSLHVYLENECGYSFHVSLLGERMCIFFSL